MGGEVMVLAVLKNQNATFLQQSMVEDELWDSGQFLERIGRVGEDEVELLAARLDESEHISPDGNHLLAAQFCDARHNKAVVVAVEFHADYLAAAA
jgi:hypothetical protein